MVVHIFVVCPVDMLPSVRNEDENSRSGDETPYFSGETVTYACATGFTASPDDTPIVATCTSALTWNGPQNRDRVCRRSKKIFVLNLFLKKRTQTK